MVKINKPEDKPIIPYSQQSRTGECKLLNATARVKTQYEDNTSVFNRSWRPDHSIYGHDIIKEELKKNVQHQKCCYCEKEILSNYTVEHYRPSGGYQEELNGTVIKPGYYWLAYEWSNLFYACNDCNRRKNAFFPIDAASTRAGNHIDDELCATEIPLLVDLVNEDPEEFIEFIELEPFGTTKNRERGEITIQAVGLRHRDMFDERISHWNKILKYKQITQKRIERLEGEAREEEINWYNNYLDEKCDPRLPFSRLIACNRVYFELEL